DVINGHKRSWVDRKVIVGHSYVYNVTGEFDSSVSSQENAQIPFKSISVDSIPSDQRKAIRSAVTRQKSSDDLKREGDKYSFTIRWSSPEIPDMVQWSIERREGGMGGQPKELAR